MSRKTLSTIVVIPLAAVLAISACRYLVAQETARDNSVQTLPAGDYMITLTTGSIDAKLISKAELVNIGGKSFLKCTLIDTDAVKEEYRGTTCLVSVDQIVSIQEFPSQK